MSKDPTTKLENANKDYHEMHATFLSKRWENKHVLYGVQDTVKIKILFYQIFMNGIFMLLIFRLQFRNSFPKFAMIVTPSLSP